MIHVSEVISKERNHKAVYPTDQSSLSDRPPQYVRQTQRNTIETHSKHTPESEKKNQVLTDAQRKYIMMKTGCTHDELEKAIRIIGKSSPKPKNIMGYLQTSAFFQGECILEPTQEERELSREEQARREEQAVVSARVEKLTANMQGSITAALSWYQNLSDPIRAKVRSNIIRMRPEAAIYFEGKKPFGPLMFVLLREQKRRMEGEK